MKPVAPYIKRAEDLDRDNSNPNTRVVAYFCRMYAIDVAMRLKNPDNKDEVQTLVMALLTMQEKARVELGDDAKKENGQVICEDYALTSFSQADDQERVGPVTKITAKLFYNTITYFEILDQFGEVPESIVEKRKYSKLKATTILKCIKEGGVPQPSGYVDPARNLQEFPDVSTLGLPSAPPCPLIFRIKVQSLTGMVYFVDASPMDPVLHIKERLFVQCGIPPQKQLLKLAGVKSWLQDTASVADSGIQGESLLQLVRNDEPPSVPSHLAANPLLSRDNSNSSAADDVDEIIHFASSSIKARNFSQARQRLEEARRRCEEDKRSQRQISGGSSDDAYRLISTLPVEDRRVALVDISLAALKAKDFKGVIARISDLLDTLPPN